MKLKINLAVSGSGLSVDDTLEVYCGEGEQVLQWIGQVACSRLAYKRGEMYGRYVPQSVTSRDGQPLDIDIVINEILHDGDEIFVEYSNGPTPYRVRWEGRPRTPPFRWGDAGEVLPHHSTWLLDLDLKAEGLGALIDPDLVKADPSIVDRDLDTVKELLLQHAGAMQMLFMVQSSEGITSGEQLGQITLPQFRAMMVGARAITARFPAEKVDEIFTSVATSEQTLARKVENKSGVSTFDLLDFMVALVHVGHHRFAAESPSQAPYTQLSQQVLTLFKDCFSVHAYPDLQRKLDRFMPGLNHDPAKLLLRKGRRLIEHTLDSCQLKRSRAAPSVKVDLRWLCTHLARWGMLGKDFMLPELALISVFAKQEQTDPEEFELKHHPIDLDYNEFERLLLGIAWHVHITKKQQGNFEELLGDVLDSVFKKAGVLVQVQNGADGDDHGDD